MLVRANGPTPQVTEPHYVFWRTHSTVFESLTAYSDGSYNLSSAATPRSVRGSRVTPDFFTTFGVDLVLGPGFSGRDSREVVLSHGLWRDSFAADETIVGRQIPLDSCQLHGGGGRGRGTPTASPPSRAVDTARDRPRQPRVRCRPAGGGPPRARDRTRGGAGRDGGGPRATTRSSRRGGRWRRCVASPDPGLPLRPSASDSDPPADRWGLRAAARERERGESAAFARGEAHSGDRDSASTRRQRVADVEATGGRDLVARDGGSPGRDRARVRHRSMVVVVAAFDRRRCSQDRCRPARRWLRGRAVARRVATRRRGAGARVGSGRPEPRLECALVDRRRAVAALVSPFAHRRRGRA